MIDTNAIPITMPDGVVDLPGINLFPPHLRKWVILLVLLHPYFTRGWYAFRSGGGLRGFAASIWLGTNTPLLKQTTKGQNETKPQVTNEGVTSGSNTAGGS